MSKILLIQASSVRNRQTPEIDSSVPLGLIYVGTALKSHGHEVKILDRDLSPSNDYLFRLLKENYDFVGLGVFTNPMLYDAIDVSKMVKENSNSIIIWGGFHVMSVPEVTLENPYVDYILRGEVEEVFPKLLELYEKKKSFNKLKGINLNPLPTPPDIDKLPLPDYSLVELDKYSDFPVSTSRGCPYLCSFCYNSYGNESIKPYRNLNVEKSIELIRNVKEKYKKNFFTMVDDNFPSNIKRVEQICEGIKDLDLRFNAFCRANYATIDVLSTLKKGGCWQVDIGIESGSQRILNFLNKATTMQINAEAIKNCRKVGISSNGLFMIGIPTETIEDIKETENFIRTYRPDFGGVAIFYLLPRTKLWDFCKDKGWIKEPKTLEEWADLYPIGFKEPKTNFSEIPNETLLNYRKELNKLLNNGRYIRKMFLYLKNGRVPSFERILNALFYKFGKEKT